MKWLIYSAIIVRIGTQLSCDFITNTFIEGLVYAIGVAYFELVALYVFTRVLSGKDWFLNFALGLCLFDLFKFLFLMPYEISIYDYFNVLFGVLFSLFIYFKQK